MKSTNKIVRVMAFTLAALSLLTVKVSAQTGTTSLRGTITDPNGASVPDAAITITSPGIGVTLTTKTNKDGAYQFLEVRPATYDLTVSASGFATTKQSNLQLLVATPTTDNIQLVLASVATVVEVSGTATTVNTTDATIGNAFNQTQISSLPFEGRDPAAILSLQPGVVTVADRGRVDTNGDSRGGAVNGARSDQTNITLDGIGDNDEVKGNAFQGALRATLDSIEELRVTTTNSGADQGRSSGAQVSQTTKSGTNSFHGGAYEYHRPKNTVANDWFNKHSELQHGLPNKPASLLRNTFGATAGGPIWKDRAYFFLAYEGQRTRESQQVSHTVPSQALRSGVIQYGCAPILNPDGSVKETAQQVCPGGKVAQGQSGFSLTTQPGFYALGPSEIAQMDTKCSGPSGTGTCPWGAGIDPNVIATMNLYPLPNSDNLGDGLNYRSFTFSAPVPAKLDTYVARFDYNLTQSGTQRLFARLGLQNDHGVPTTTPGDNVGTNTGAPQFPGQPDSVVATNNTKGIIAGYLWSISPTKVNNFHYGFIRQGRGTNGASQASFVRLRGLDNPTADNRTTSVIVPVHSFTDDYSWSKGKHTFGFGGNYRLITNIRTTNANSFSDGITNTGFLVPTGISNQGGSFDPAASGFPAVDPNFGNSYDYPMMALAGVITEVDTTFLQNKAGQSLPNGAVIGRHFRDNEFEFYAQDAWRIKNNVTVTYGLRYSLLQPPYETNGNQVNPSFSLHDFFNTRIKDMQQGISYSPTFTMNLSGPANGKPGYWGWDYKNLAPRLSLAWSPGYKDGLLGGIFGGAGKSSVRLGAGMYYDHFGQGVIDTFDQHGSFGFVSNITFPPGTVSLDTAPRYTGIHDLPPSLLFSPAPTTGFPQTPPNAFAIYWGLDDKLKTPYSYAFDLSVTRELKSGFTLELAYVGRISRNLLQEKDLAQPANLVDPKSGLSYFQAVTGLAQVYRKQKNNGNLAPTLSFDPSSVPANVAQYWTDMLQPLSSGGAYRLQYCTGKVNGNPVLSSTNNPVTAAYDLFCGGSLNETTPLSVLDTIGIADSRNAANCVPAGSPPNPPNPNCVGFFFPKNSQAASGYGPYAFYQSQYASLFAWTSSGRANFNALQVMLRHRATHGLSFDFNYMYSKSIDMGSDAERVSLFQGSFFGTGEVYNPFSPGLFRAVSDYDMTHQINSNWVYELPVGHGKKWGSSWHRGMDAIVGGWTLSGLGKWSSGLPFSIQNGFQFPTNWELNGLANMTGPKPRTGIFTDCSGDPNMFAESVDPSNCSTNNGVITYGANFISKHFSYPFPGQVGTRNKLRGPGYFGIDMALRKTWNLTERQTLSFSWEVFNVTNSVRFDAFSALPALDNSGSFGKYTSTLTNPRVMEFALRYSF